jgi:putative ABC transport system ATP-binding protein
MSLLEIRDVKKNYHLGKTIIPALRGVSFKVSPGDFISIVGPSGCGKTTLLNIIGCIDNPTEGTVIFDGTDVATLNDNEKAEKRIHKIGFIFQSFNLIPVLNIAENIEFPLILSKVPKYERKLRVEKLIEIVDLGDFTNHKPDELSGGQRQRVAIARALINNPSLVIADEPTANLDSETGDMIIKVMKDLNQKHHVTFIFSTHNPEVVRHAKKIIKLRDGRIEEQ